MLPIHILNLLHRFPLQLRHNIQPFPPSVILLHPEIYHGRNNNHARLRR